MTIYLLKIVNCEIYCLIKIKESSKYNMRQSFEFIEVNKDNKYILDNVLEYYQFID